MRASRAFRIKGKKHTLNRDDDRSPAPCAFPFLLEGVCRAHNLLVGTSSVDHWVITLSYRHPGLTGADMDRWEDGLANLDGTVAANPATGTVGITLHVESVSLAAAFSTAYERAAITGLQPIAAEVVSWTEHDDRAAMFTGIGAGMRSM